MYINPFIAGVLATVSFEFLSCMILVMILSFRGKK